MIQRYRSLHRNHVHQMIVTVSKHYFMTKEGLLKYQAKPLEASLEKLAEAKKRNIIYLSIRDHCSGMFYFEIACSSNLPNIHDFLLRAWSKKNDYPFSGIPNLILYPKKLDPLYPSLQNDLESIGIKRVAITSGFQGGIGDIKYIESNLCFLEGKKIDDVHLGIPFIYLNHANAKGRGGERTKIEMWESSDYEIVLPPQNWSFNQGN